MKKIRVLIVMASGIHVGICGCGGTGAAVKKGFLSNCSNLQTVASISDRILIRYSASKI
jgi:hypothetical protein